MNAAIYFHPDGYTVTGPKLMGRNVAGESFLRAYLEHTEASEFFAQVSARSHGQMFEQLVRAAGRDEPVSIFGANGASKLSTAGTLYFPGPNFSDHAWKRAAYGHDSWSLCGITHTTASAQVMDAIAEWLTAPVQVWDAVICTSAAVRDNVQRVLQAQADYLSQRLQPRQLVLPQLPVIPLGIHTQDFVFSDAQRSAARSALGADAHTHVVLYVGRLSFHAKAHPLAMYQALQQAAEGLPPGDSVVLVECGWHGAEFIEAAFREAALAACPAVRVVTLDGRKPEERQIAWASADVFCSLSDNIQETFGITPIEAMAAALPVVVSDWDGYKDTVRHGVDGFRIPTLMPQAGLGMDLALRHALGISTYDDYCGLVCALVGVDIGAAAQAFSQLFASAQLRQTLGAAGRQRARAVYDWAIIIPQYEALWAHLAEQRQAHGKTVAPLVHPWPARMDPFAAFATYPTTSLTQETPLALSSPDALQRFEHLRGLAMVSYAQEIMPEAAECQALIAQLTQGPVAAGALLHDVTPARQAIVFRALAWLVKLGVLCVSRNELP